MNCCCDGVDDEVSTRNSNLGYDLVCKILSFLPVKTLIRAKCVCKSWRYLVESDPHFIYLHYTQSKARPNILVSHKTLLVSNKVNSEYGTNFSSAYLYKVIDHGEVVFKVTASLAEPMLKPVNGLICFIRSSEPAVLIYNLSTRKQTPWIETITKPSTKEKAQLSWNYNQFYGFGFDPATKEHKVLRVLTKKRERTTSIMPSTTHDHLKTDDDFCEVLTVGQNSWRRIDQVPPHKVCFRDAFYANGVCFRSAVYANGALYWLCNGGDPHNYTLPDCIVVFDVGSEKFIRVIPIPNFIRRPPKHYWTKCLFIVDGRPTLIGRTRTNDYENNMTIKMWTFDDENWIEETISLPCQERPVLLFSFEAIEGTDLIMIQSNRRTTEPVLSVYYYNWKKKTWTSSPRGGLTIKNTPPCSDSFSLDKPFGGFPYNYNVNYQISTFVESLFTLQN